MKTLVMAALAAFLWYAVLELSASAWDAEMDAREAIDHCLYMGGTPSQCMEVHP